MASLEFSGHESTTHRAIVVSLDLGGFSNFCNQSEPSVAVTVPNLIKRVFDLLNEFFRPEEQPDVLFPVTKEDGRLIPPHFIKYTGDGALMFWFCSPKTQFSQKFCNLVVESMRNFQIKLSTQLPKWEKEWRIQKLPRNIRVGIATGVVYALRPPHMFTSLTAAYDFVGYCINLAVRLQSHCPPLGFLVHGNLHPELQGMEHLRAIKLKGSQEEPVSLFSEDLKRVTPIELQRKFVRSS